MNEQYVLDTTSSLVESAEGAVVKFETKVAGTAGLHAASVALAAEVSGFKSQFEAIEARIIAKLSENPAPSAGLFALATFGANPDNSRPSEFPNLVAGGSRIMSYGTNKGLGGRVGNFGAYGLGVFSEGPDGNKTCLQLLDTVTIPGPCTLENVVRMGLADGSMMHFGDTGLGDSASQFLRIYALAETTAGKRKFRCRFKAFGKDETFDTDEIPGRTVNGQPDIYHLGIVRNADWTFSVMSDEKRQKTTVNKFEGTLVGKWDAFGRYENQANAAESVFRTIVGAIRGHKSAIYTGNTYAFPTTPWALA